jgi:hypothetical protein
MIQPGTNKVTGQRLWPTTGEIVLSMITPDKINRLGDL